MDYQQKKGLFRVKYVHRLPIVFTGKIWCVFIFLSIACSGLALAQSGPLAGKVICIDPGHGGTAATDSYRQGPTGEREEWVNLRVGEYLQALLEAHGARVVMTRTIDEQVPLARRAELARENKADIFLSIHHNATADPEVNFPIIYFHGNASENLAGVRLGESLARAFRKLMYRKDVPVSIVSDHTIFAGSGAAVLRGTYGIPAVLAEASFFTHPPEEQRLKDTVYNRQEAEAYLDALINYFSEPVPPIHAKNSMVEQIPPFRGLQEADRMSPVAKKWHDDYTAGLALMNKTDSIAWREAYDYFTRSARSFPDSYVAGQNHQHRAELLQRLGQDAEAKQEAIRAAEYYVPGWDGAASQSQLSTDRVMALLDSVKAVYIPDARTDYFAAEIGNGQPMTITVESTLPQALESATEAIRKSRIDIGLNIKILPDESDGSKTYAVSHLSVANHRFEPGNRAELVTQTLLGTPMRILKTSRGHHLVRTPDNYLSWVPASSVTAMDKAAFEKWLLAEKIVYTSAFGHSFMEPSDNSRPVSDLVHGDILETTGKRGKYMEVIYPDGRAAYVHAEETAPYAEWASRPNPVAADILTIGKSLMGVPYLWGGTSIKGVDCSGFTKTCYFLNGIILPRDASQQALVGDAVDVWSADTVDIGKCVQNLAAGDLLFFGRKRDDGSTAVTHTGIYMGSGEFIHSSGLVKINSMVTGTENYSSLVSERLVGVRRILSAVGSEGVSRVDTHAWYNGN